MEIPLSIHEKRQPNIELEIADTNNAHLNIHLQHMSLEKSTGLNRTRIEDPQPPTINGKHRCDIHRTSKGKNQRLSFPDRFWNIHQSQCQIIHIPVCQLFCLVHGAVRENITICHRRK